MQAAKPYAGIVSLVQEYVERHEPKVSGKLFVLKAYANVQAGGREYGGDQWFCVDSLEYAMLDAQGAPCSVLYVFEYDADGDALFLTEDCTKHAG